MRNFPPKKNDPKLEHMTYPIIPMVLIPVFLGYVLYLIFIKKDLKSQFKTVVLPGALFIVIWAVLYYFLL